MITRMPYQTRNAPWSEGFNQCPDEKLDSNVPSHALVEATMWAVFGNAEPSLPGEALNSERNAKLVQYGLHGLAVN